MAEIDYGYGDSQPDYGYGEAEPAQPDYGYGEAQPDYGYGDQDPAPKPSQTDFGYGDAQPDYGYGDSAPADNPYGYDQAEQPAAPTAAAKRSIARRQTKRRCSVTKYSLEAAAESNSTSQEAEMVHQLQAAEMLQRFRNGEGTAQSASHIQQLPPHVPQPEAAPESGDCVEEGDADPETAPDKKKGVLRKIRKRLSIAF